MAGKLSMGEKELQRGKVMEMVKRGQLTLKEGSKQLRISYRQGKRIYAAYKAEGDKALIHGNRGKRSNRRTDEGIRDQALKAYRERYEDFGPTFAAEKLEECEGISISHETLRGWLLTEGLWQRKRQSNPHRSRRERRACFGELIQFDGSHHDWFEGRRGKCCLMNMVDDATGTTLSLLDEEETTVAAMQVLSCWIKKYGIPQAVYCDHKNAFVLNREPNRDEQLAGIEPRSPFELACDKLGIQVITANSPQAKGRVERNHGVYQDRFVKELRLAGISSIEEANTFLKKTYLPKINRKFARLPADPTNAHIPLLGVDLRDIFCFEHKRVLSNDFVVSFKRRLFQITAENQMRPRPRDRVLIRIRLTGCIDFYWQGKKLLVKEIQTKKEIRSSPLSA
jgi:transposase